MKTYVLFFFASIASFTLIAQSTSNNPDITKYNANQNVRLSSSLITFDDNPINPNNITNQYGSEGILFNGCSIEVDGANPSTPVLSGPLSGGAPFITAITGNFVVPGPGGGSALFIPGVVNSFSFDAGYFDQIGMTELTWFDVNGMELGSVLNTTIGIETFTVNDIGIHSWTIDIVGTEDAGFAIDNVGFDTPCVADLALNFPSDSDPLYQSGASITGTGLVTSDLELISNTINLSPPFEVQLGIEFEAIIQVCP